jgi:hypothetical protein
MWTGDKTAQLMQSIHLAADPITLNIDTHHECHYQRWIYLSIYIRVVEMHTYSPDWKRVIIIIIIILMIY